MSCLLHGRPHPCVVCEVAPKPLQAAAAAQATHYCARCGTTYTEEGECEWCPGHVQLYALAAKPAAELP